MENKTFEQYLAELDNALKALENKDATTKKVIQYIYIPELH